MDLVTTYFTYVNKCQCLQVAATMKMFKFFPSLSYTLWSILIQMSCKCLNVIYIPSV